MKNLSFLIILLPILFFMSTGINENLTENGKTLEQMVEDGDDILIIDVRTPDEFSEGHIIGAVNMPYDLIVELIEGIPLDKQLILYCRSGRRSGIASKELKDIGYTNILDYKRYSDWKGKTVK